MAPARGAQSLEPELQRLTGRWGSRDGAVASETFREPFEPEKLVWGPACRSPGQEVGLGASG
jgi:hypothetical protein